MTFEYLKLVQAFDSIEIDDIGNTCVNALNDLGQEWFLIISTSQGWTTVIEFGPLSVDSDKLPGFFNYIMYSYEYKELKIQNTIDKFINNSKKMITQVQEVSKEFAKERLNEVKEQL